MGGIISSSQGSIWYLNAGIKNKDVTAISNISMSGLSGVGILKNVVDNAKTAITFTGNGSYEFNGILQSRFNNNGTTAKLNLVMDSADGSGVQKIYADSTSPSYLTDITAKSGTIALRDISKVNGTITATTNGSKRGTVLLDTDTANNTVATIVANGGLIGSAEANDDLYLNNVQISNGGGFAFASLDHVIFINGIDFSGAIDIDFSELDFSGVIIGNEYELLISDDLIGLTQSDFTATGLSALYAATFAVDSLGTLTATFASIPEPATVASIFGALALALAAYRRRR